MYAVALLQGMVFYAPIATLYRQQRGIGIFQIGLIESISLIVMISLELPWGYIADKIGYKKTIILCNILYFCSKIVFWRAHTFGAFLTERLMLAVVLAGLSGCDMAFLFNNAEKSDTRKIFGTYHAMSTGGIVLASFLFSAVIRNNYDLAALLTVVSYAAALLISLLLTDIKIDRSVRSSPLCELKEVFADIGKNKNLLYFIFAGALLIETNQTVTVFLSQLQYVRCGISLTAMGFIHIAVTLIGLLSVGAGRFADKAGEKRLLSFLFIFAILSCLAMGLWANAALAVAGMIILRLCASLFMPLSNHIQNSDIAVSSRATVLSFYSVLMNFTAVSTNLIFGKAAESDVSYGLFAGAGLCALGLVLLVFWQKRTQSDTKK